MSSLFRQVCYIILFLFVHEASSQSQRGFVTLYGLHNVSEDELTLIKNGLETFYSIKVTIKKFPQIRMVEEVSRNDIVLAKPLFQLFGKNDSIAFTGKSFFITNKKLSISEIPFQDKERYLIRGFAESIADTFAIVSTYKLKIEAESDVVFRKLLIKTARHEFGHLLGLAHCSEEKCLMNSGIDPLKFQNLEYYLCEACSLGLDSLNYK